MIRMVISLLRPKFGRLVMYRIDDSIAENLSEMFPASTSEIEELLRICISIIHAPINCSGLIRAESAMRNLVRRILETSGTVSSYAITMVDDMLCSFFDVLGRSDQKTLSSRIHVTIHPEFGFFVTAAERPRTATPLYVAFCASFQVAIERVSWWDIEKHTKEAWTRACRYFFEFMPDNIKFDPTLPTRQFNQEDVIQLIKSAIANYQEANKGKGDKVSVAASRYEKMLTQLLLHNKAARSHPHSGARNKHKKNEIKVTKINWTETPDKPGKIAIGYEERIPGTTTVGEVVLSRKRAAPDIPDEKEDLNEPFASVYILDNELTPVLQTDEQQRQLRLRIYDALNLRAFIFPFDTRFPNLYHMSILAIQINELWPSASIMESMIIVLLLLLFWTENHPEYVMLMGLHYGDKPPQDFEKHNLYITKANGRYCLLKQALIQYKKSPKGSENCRSTASVVEIPLPSILNPFIDRVWGERTRDGYYFSAVSPFIETAFGLDAVKEFLDKHINFQYGSQPYPPVSS